MFVGQGAAWHRLVLHGLGTSPTCCTVWVPGCTGGGHAGRQQPPLLYISTSVNPLQLGLSSGEQNNPAARSSASAQINRLWAWRGRSASPAPCIPLPVQLCCPVAPLAPLKKPFCRPWRLYVGAPVAEPGGQLGMPMGSSFAPWNKQSFTWWPRHGHTCLWELVPPAWVLQARAGLAASPGDTSPAGRGDHHHVHPPPLSVVTLPENHGSRSVFPWGLYCHHGLCLGRQEEEVTLHQASWVLAP